MPEGTERAR